MYHGPEHGRVDNYFLSKVLHAIDLIVPTGTKICLIGGSALSALGIREKGSDDIDLISTNHHGAFSDALRTVNNKIARKEITIQITHKGITTKTYVLDDHAFVQDFSTNLPSARIVDEFEKRMHRIKKIAWVMPEGGKMTSVRTKRLFKRLELHALGLLDLFCVKLYAGRERDRADITSMLEDIHKTKKYYRRYRKELKALLTKYLEHNKQKAPYVIKLYNYYQEKHPKILLPLDDEIMSAYGLKR